MAHVQRGEAVDAGVSISFAPSASGSSPVSVVDELADGRAVGLHADGVDDRVGPAAVGQRPGRRRPRSSVASRRSSDLDAVAPGPLEPLGDEVDADHPVDAAVLGDAGGHVADRAEPEHDDACRRRGRRRTRRPATPWAARRRGRRTGRRAAPRAP